MGWTAGVQFLARDVYLLHSVQTSSGAYPSSYPMGTGAFFMGVKRSRHEADHSPPPSVEVKNGGVIPLLPHMSSGMVLN
jgi:hypothetical protein